MKQNTPIQVFEYDHLKIGVDSFKKHHWEKLGWYNEQHGGRFFQLTPQGVRFKQFVGVIQVGDITIELLPKIGKTATKGDEHVWQRVLIDMLRECKWMQIHAHEKASLRFKHNNILEAYLELFIIECERLLREGLIKKYKRTASKNNALKGRLMFSEHVKRNFIHQEKFYTEFTIYTRENLFNQILLKALKLIPTVTKSSFLKDRVYSILLGFPDLNDVRVTPETFDQVVYDRKSERYRQAMEIAAMLLLNYRPDITTGRNHVLAILFDMNDLWEEYIFRQLSKRKPEGWQIGNQNRKPFWRLEGSSGYKKIRPDIIITDLATDKSAVVDTKWKLPESNLPDDGDLKQMFVYNNYWGSDRAFLLYPVYEHSEGVINFPGEYSYEKGKCGILKVSVLNKAKTGLDVEIGRRLQSFIRSECFQ